MKCNQCSEAIPAKSAHAISKNECPFCGGEIMDPTLQDILTNLNLLMKEAGPHMEAVEEWLNSNYQLYKGGSMKRSPTGIIQDDVIEGSGSITAQIQRRAEIGKMTGGKLTRKDILEKIKGEGGYAADPAEFVGEDPDYGHIDMSQETASPLSKREAEQMLSAINGAKPDPVKEYYEMEKLKKLQRTGGATPKISKVGGGD